MNKAITEGIVLMPTDFASGLNVWSSGDGTPGSDTYAGAGNAAYVPSDADFAGALEVQKTQAVQKLRYMGQTPILPGCYLRITARVKAVSGNLPAVRIAGFAAAQGGAALAGVPLVSAETQLTGYGTVTEISAIVGVGNRDGVDLVWGPDAAYGHFGIDLTGGNGGVLRIDDIEIEDITGAFLRDLMNWVDVRDYGAIGDGVSDDAAAFEAADVDADGRMVLVSDGTYFLGSDVTIDSRVDFQGTVTMPDQAILTLASNFDLPKYIDAFGDSELAFKKAFQSLLNNSSHESLDMGGRKVNLTEPLDMQAASGRDSFATRRILRNGQFEAQSGAAWDTAVVTSQASYDPGNSRILSNVVNVANVPVGALVEGSGVGREVYVRARNIAQQTLTLNLPLYDAAGTQNFTFSRYRYLLDFSGFSQLSKFGMTDIEFQCGGIASGIMMAQTGIIFQLRDCFVSRPANRGLTSTGTACQGMLIDRCHFLSDEDNVDVSGRVSIAFNASANDVKVRDNRATRFRHFCVLGGSNSLVLGNHFFQGDGVAGGVRSAGIVIGSTYCSTIVSGNYVDNCSVEWTNEYDPSPAFTTGFSFAALTLSDNIFLSGEVAPWFSYLIVKPHGAGHFLNGVTVTGNRFRSANGAINRAERVDTTFANLDFTRSKDVTFAGNSYHNVTAQSKSPIRVLHAQNTAADQWTFGAAGELPFGARVRGVDAVTVEGDLRDAAGAIGHAAPSVRTGQGGNGDLVTLDWAQAYRGTVAATLRIDT